MKKNKKIFISFFLAIFCFSFSISNALAFDLFELADISDGVTTGAMNEIIDDLGINKDEMKYNINDMNSSRQKKQEPQVQVTFSPANPVPGQKVTATATPMYFMSEDKNMYFTWYIKSPGKGGDVEDWKARAARIIANNDFEYQKESYNSDSDDDGYRAYMGGDDQSGKGEHCYIHDTASGNEYELNRLVDNTWVHDCSHLFPEAPGHDTGDNSFGADEEKYWHTNPNDPDTADLGHNDEASIAGLGVNSFTWTYAAGDEVGVVVEGISIEATQYRNATSGSTYKIMWALPKNKCDEMKKHSKTGTPGTVNSMQILMRASDINECLEQNLIDPAEGGGTKEKMDIALSYSPDFPMNDSSTDGQDANRLTINSSITNAVNDGYLNYSWQVYKSDEANPDDWGDPLTKSQLKDSAQTSGMGADSLSFLLNFPDSSAFYLKVKLTVRENVSGNLVREGHSDIVIPVTSATEKIRAFKTVVSTDNTSGNATVGMTSEELCASGDDQALCPVVKDQIIGLEVSSNTLSDFSWTINGDPFEYSTCFFEGCDLSRETNVAYFPILDETGEQYEVTLTATDISSGKKINLTRTFQVADPEVQITSVSENTCQPVLLGHYIDYDGKEWPDYSENNFQAIAGENITLTANFIGFIPESGNFGWIVDGVEVTKDNASALGYEINDNNELTISAAELGESINVGLDALYFPDTQTKKMLNAYWGINYGDFFETEVGNSIDIASVDSLSGGSVSKNTTSKNKIMASLFSSTPTYLAFLFRIVLTGLLLLFFSSFILSFFPKIKTTND
jgi:hypothetical protein